jgi:hypothetical protein
MSYAFKVAQNTLILGALCTTLNGVCLTYMEITTTTQPAEDER